MAKEIKKNILMSWSKGGAEILVKVEETLDQIGEQAIESVQIIGATSEAISFGDVTGDAHLAFKNLTPAFSTLTLAQKSLYTDKADYDAKNTAYVGTTNPVTSVNAEHKLTPGGSAGPFISALAWYGIKATNDVNLLVFAIEV